MADAAVEAPAASPTHASPRPQSERGVGTESAEGLPRQVMRAAFRRQMSASAGAAGTSSSALPSPAGGGSTASPVRQPLMGMSGLLEEAHHNSFSSRYLRRVPFPSRAGKTGSVDSRIESNEVNDLNPDDSALQQQLLHQQSPPASLPPPDEVLPVNDPLQQTYLDHGIRYFNLNPVKGLKYLIDKKVIRAKDVPEFLKSTRGLNKVQIGVILGDDSGEGRRRLKAYMGLFDFAKHAPTAAGVEQALRSTLKCFKPSGDAQKIERVLLAFAEKFSGDVQGALSVDTVNALAYVVVLVNVDLHNPNNTRKMTKEDLYKSTGSMPELKDIESEELSALYDSIQACEIKHVADREDLMGNLFTQPVISGQLEMRSRGSSRLFARTSWRSRFFVLSKNTLYYFKRATDPEPRGFIPLQDIVVQSRESSRFGWALSSDEDDRSSLMMARSLASTGTRLASACPSLPSSPFSRRNTPNAAQRGPSARFALLPAPPRLVIKSAKISSLTGLVNLEHGSLELRASSREVMDEWVRAIQANVIASGQPQLSLSRSDGFLNRLASYFDSSPSSSTHKNRSTPPTPSVPQEDLSKHATDTSLPSLPKTGDLVIV